MRLASTGNLTVSGFTSHGTGNTGIKVKHLTGTGSAETGLTRAHGLTASKIISVTVDINSAGKLYTRDATNIIVSGSYGEYDTLTYHIVIIYIE
jgi:hypothetical protein